MVIMDQLTEQAETFVDQLTSPVPIALIDLKTLRMLERLGDSSPISGAQPLTQAPETPWLTRARQQLANAHILMEQELDTGVIELLCSAATALITYNDGS